MKGQPLMKHSPALIGVPVHVYRHEWQRPDIPRAGFITGFGSDKGLFTVMVLHCPVLDMRKSLPPLGFLEHCLVVDDPDDTPIGVTQYARLRPHISVSAPEHLAANLMIAASASPNEDSTVSGKGDPEVESGPTKPAANKGAKGGKGGKKDNPEQPAPAPEANPAPTPTRPPGRTAPEILRNSPAWFPIKEIEGIEVGEVSPTEMIITLDHDDRPIARITYAKPQMEPNTVNSEPIGFTFKLRDSAGRCSKILAEHQILPDEVTRACRTLALAIRQAQQAELGDWASAAANMQAVINTARSE